MFGSKDPWLMAGFGLILLSSTRSDEKGQIALGLSGLFALFMGIGFFSQSALAIILPGLMILSFAYMIFSDGTQKLISMLVSLAIFLSL